MKLSSKIHLYSSVLFVSLLLAANITVYFVFYSLTIEQELHTLAAETEQAAEAIRASNNRLATEELMRAYVPVSGMIRLTQETANGGGGLLVTSSSETALSDQQSAYSPERIVEKVRIGQKDYGYSSIPIIAADGAVANVQVTKSMEELTSLLAMLRLVLIGVSIAVIIIVLLSSGLLSRLIMRPIGAMTRTMKEIARSGKFVRLEQHAKSKDELSQMGETFNEMIGLLESSFHKQEQFVSNASHELKTPLTIIESYASLLQRRGLERPELFLESVEAIRSEAVRMKGMTEQLLLLATPNRQQEHERKVIELLPEVEQAATGFRRAYKRDIYVQAPAEPIYADTNADQLKQLLFILLDNARKYSQDRIDIELERDSRHSMIRIKDRGIGIPEVELRHVFERFYRVDPSRSRDQDSEGGTGLGLSLAQEISRAIGAEIVLASEEDKGTTATLLLPLPQQE
jgi:signal transduction histidine kinase